MHWQKLGLIFNPADYDWGTDFAGYAQSPQALCGDGFIRIYFATRKRDAIGKFVSHIRYVDFADDFSRVLDWSRHEVLGPGKPGCFDEHGVFPMNPLRVGSSVYGYTNGWTRRVSVSVDTGIGLVVSHDDGRTFQRIGDGPVLSATLHEPFLVGDPFVHHTGGHFHMWYIYGKGWKTFTPDGVPERIYKIAHAISGNGIDWEKDARDFIPDRLDADECQALPTVAEYGGRYHMFFCYRRAFDFRQNALNGYRLGYAVSDDLVHWQRDDDAGGLAPSSEGWDAQMMCYPHVFSHQGQLFLLYNGNEFGRHGFGLARLETTS